MKKILFISGITLIAAGIILLLAGGLFYYTHHHTLDGSAELYKRLHNKATVCFIMGTVTELCGIIAMSLRYKLY